MTYSEKLKDPRWQRKRLKILERDNFQCRHCMNTLDTLHVHHLDYIAGHEPWEYPNEYLITLCYKCHEAVKEERGNFEQSLVKVTRLTFVDPFSQNCFSDVLKSYTDLNDIVYLLWEMKDYESDVIDNLRQLWSIKKREFLTSIAEPTDIKCKACGSDMHKLKDVMYLCSVCGWENPIK